MSTPSDRMEWNGPEEIEILVNGEWVPASQVENLPDPPADQR